MKNTYARHSLKCLTAAAVTLVIAAPAVAQKNKGAENGQPFQSLQSEIDANRAAIATNSAAISALNEDVAEIEGAIADLQTDLAAIQYDVDQNTSDIAEAFSRISTTEENVSDLQGDLAALTRQQAIDTRRLEINILRLEQELQIVNELRIRLAEQLEIQLAALEAKVHDNMFAIDGLLIQIISLNAELTTVNSNILSIQTTLSDLDSAVSSNSDAITSLQSLVSSLESDVDALQAGNLFTFSGIMTNLAIADLNGWEQCFSTLYSDRTSAARPETMEAACTGSQIMLACRATGSDTLLVAANAPRDEVFFNTGDVGNNLNEANGVDWYYSLNRSMGFAPVGEGVMRNSADVQDRSSPLRLSWHTNIGFVQGWRCGSNTSLNSSSSFEKLIFQAD